MPESETISCVVESVFDHVMTPPAATMAGFGTKAAVPSVRALTWIVIVVDDGVVGEVGVDGDEDL
jgi:hypothetical protein